MTAKELPKVRALMLAILEAYPSAAPFASGLAFSLVEKGYGHEKEAVSQFMGEVLSMQGENIKTAMKRRFKQKYGS